MKILQKLFIPFIGFGLIFISFLPTITAYRQTPPNHFFSGAHNYPHDYFIYLSYILNSKNGAITTTVKFTSEKQNGTFILHYYILGGKAAKIFNLSPSFTYHLMRFTAVLFLLFVSFLWIKEIFKTSFSKNMSFFLLVTAASFPRFMWSESGWKIYPFFNWWTGTDILRSWTFIPHHVLANAFTLLLLLIFAKYLKQNRLSIGLYFLSILSIIFLGLSSPIHLLVVLLTVGLTTIIILLKTRSWNKQLIVNLIIFFSISAITLIYFLIAMQQSPYKEANEWEKSQVISTPFIDYLASIGPIVILGFLGILIFFTARISNKALVVLKIYIAVTLLLLITGLTRIFGANPIRLVEVSLILPFAIFATIFINSIKKISKIIIGIIVILIILNTYNSFKISLETEMAEKPSWAYNLYPDTTFLKSLYFLSQNTKPDEIVLVDPFMADYIPAFAGNTVYVDNLINTLNFEKKLSEEQSFYKGEITNSQAINWIHEKNIKYVFWGLKEKEYNQNLVKTYSFLKPIFERDYITIFSVD